MCTRILWNTDRLGVFVARTMDWPTTTDPKLMVFPRGVARDGGLLGSMRLISEDLAFTWTSRYGSIVASTYGLGASDGMNERGLAAHYLFFTDCEFTEPRPGRPQVHAGVWAQLLLDNAATVVEALDLLDTIDIVMVEALGYTSTVHVAIEDATGDSAVIEFVHGDKRVYHGSEHVILTNDPPYEEHQKLLADFDLPSATRETPIPGNVNPRDRFIRAAYYRHALPEPATEREALASMLAVARNVSVPFGAPYKEVGTTYNTEYRVVCDLTRLRYYFELTTCPSVVWVCLADLDLSPTAPARVLDPDDVMLVGDVTHRFDTLDPIPF